MSTEVAIVAAALSLQLAILAIVTFRLIEEVVKLAREWERDDHR